jgi:hypothetical protein
MTVEIGGWCPKSLTTRQRLRTFNRRPDPLQLAELLKFSGFCAGYGLAIDLQIETKRDHESQGTANDQNRFRVFGLGRPRLKHPEARFVLFPVGPGESVS